MQWVVVYENWAGFNVHLRFGSRTAAEVWAAQLRARGYAPEVKPCEDWTW